jgi:hypothetical protein
MHIKLWWGSHLYDQEGYEKINIKMDLRKRGGARIATRYGLDD